MGTHEHRKRAEKNLRLAILTVSSTRSLKEDASGTWIAGRAKREGHIVCDHRVVTDDAGLITLALHEILTECSPHAVLINGGTGISRKDVTVEAVRPLFEKELTAFGTLFAQLSFEEIDSAALLSRATAGLVGTALVFCMPGSLKACKLACKNLIFPEIGHMVMHSTRDS